MDLLKEQLVNIIDVMILRAMCGEVPENDDFLHPDIQITGGWRNYKIFGPQKAKFLMKDMATLGQGHKIKILSSKLTRLHADSCMMICCVGIEKTRIYPGELCGSLKYTIKLSFLWKQLDMVWKVLYLHMSDPAEVRELCTGEKVLDIDPKQLVYVEARNMRSELHFAESLVTVQESLAEWEQRLPAYFVRIHRSYLVNREYILRMERFCVHLRGGQVLPVPAKKYAQVRRLVLEEVI